MISILDVNVCFLNLIFAPILLVCVFGGGVGKIGAINVERYQWTLFPINWLVVFVYVFSRFDLLARNDSFLVVFWLCSLGWSFPFISMCRTGFVDWICIYLNLLLSQNVLLSSSNWLKVSWVLWNIVDYSPQYNICCLLASIEYLSRQTLLTFRVEKIPV